MIKTILQLTPLQANHKRKKVLKLTNTYQNKRKLLIFRYELRGASYDEYSTFYVLLPGMIITDLQSLCLKITGIMIFFNTKISMSSLVEYEIN